MANLELNNHFFDTPKGGENTSSIGALDWPPVEASFERKKGFFGTAVTNLNDFIELLEDFYQLPFDNSTRISARVIVSKEILQQFLSRSDLSHQQKQIIEAIIPLAGCGIPSLKETCLLYLGKNSENRRSPPDILQEQFKRVEGIFGRQLELRSQSFKSLPPEFTIAKLTDNQRRDPQIIEGYVNLYQPFGWSEEEIRELLGNQNNILVAVFDSQGQVVSSGMVEIGNVQITNNGDSLTFRLAEITEAATLPQYQGNGFYQNVSDEILRVLAKIPDAPNLVFGELNLDSPGVLTVAARQGRICAWQIAEQLGFPRWYLEQHVPISSGGVNNRRKDYRYNNLMPACLTQSQLLKKYG